MGCAQAPAKGPTVQDVYQSGSFSSASVIVIGVSNRFSNTPALLLGGGGGKGGYRFSDFGGNLDGGEGEGADNYATLENSEPHLGAFRELVEELLGFKEEAAQQEARRMWNVAKPKLVTGAPIVHKNKHLLYLVPAEVLDPDDTSQAKAAAALPNGKKPSAIDRLFQRFGPNKEVTGVALFAIRDLLTGKDIVKPLHSVWCYLRLGGRHGPLPVLFDQPQVEALEQARRVAAKDCRVKCEFGDANVRLGMPKMTMMVQGDRTALEVQRWEEVRIRNGICGDYGSLKDCEQYLKEWPKTVPKRAPIPKPKAGAKADQKAPGGPPQSAPAAAPPQGVAPAPGQARPSGGPAAVSHKCWCGRATWDGNAGFCSKDHMSGPPKCWCGRDTWDGNPGFCSKDHMQQPPSTGGAGQSKA